MRAIPVTPIVDTRQYANDIQVPLKARDLLWSKLLLITEARDYEAKNC
jgi:hypothetical protein